MNAGQKLGKFLQIYYTSSLYNRRRGKKLKNGINWHGWEMWRALHKKRHYPNKQCPIIFAWMLMERPWRVHGQMKAPKMIRCFRKSVNYYDRRSYWISRLLLHGFSLLFPFHSKLSHTTLGTLKSHLEPYFRTILKLNRHFFGIYTGVRPSRGRNHIMNVSRHCLGKWVLDRIIHGKASISVRKM